MELIRDAAEIVVRRPAGSSGPKTECPMDGPGTGGVFTWKGKQIELQPIHFHLMQFLWKEREAGRNRTPVEVVADCVWRGKPVADNTYWGHLSKLNTLFVSKGIPITLSYRKAHFIVEVDDVS